MPSSRTSESPPRSITARVLAPLALLGVLVVVAAMVSTTISKSDDDGGQEHAARTEEQKKDKEPKEETYTVQPGDTLISIAEDTGVSIDKIERLNPEVDPNALNAGQVIKLR